MQGLISAVTGIRSTRRIPSSGVETFSLLIKGVVTLTQLAKGKRNPSSLPEESFRPTDARKTLMILSPTDLPGWSVISVASHSRKSILQWLISKQLHQNLPLEERELLLLLSADQPDHILKVVDFSLSTASGSVRKRFAEQLRISKDFSWCSERFLGSFQPIIRSFRVWSTAKKLPPERFIGVGYKDHGSLGSGPAWQAQILLDGDDNPATVVEFALRVSQGDIFSPPSSVGVPRWSASAGRTDEPKARAKRRHH